MEPPGQAKGGSSKGYMEKVMWGGDETVQSDLGTAKESFTK